MDDIKTLAQDIIEKAEKANLGKLHLISTAFCDHVTNDSRSFETGCINWDGHNPFVADYLAAAANAAPQLARKVLEMDAELVRLRATIEENEKTIDSFCEEMDALEGYDEDRER